MSRVIRSLALTQGAPARSVDAGLAATRSWRCRSRGDTNPRQTILELGRTQKPHSDFSAAPRIPAAATDPLYLFACYVEWENREDTGAGWELISAAQSFNNDTRAHACSLLDSSRHLSCGTMPKELSTTITEKKRPPAGEIEMKAPYGLEIVDDCTHCSYRKDSFFCGFSSAVIGAINAISHKSILPAGAILFVEGQAPRGVFILCSGKVNLSTTSREGKMLILKTSMEGEALGLSATISGLGYETTAETATPCQVSFIDRKNFLQLIQSHSEAGLRAAQCLSRDYHSAYRDIHALVLTRSSAGKLARLLLSQSPLPELKTVPRVHSPMTHEEMAQRIGSSRETVTRLLSDLRKKDLISLDGPTLIIRNRIALEALAG